MPKTCLKQAVAHSGVRMMRLDQDAIVSSLAIVDREDEQKKLLND